MSFSVFVQWRFSLIAIGVLATYDEMFLAKYAESSGNARDFVWKGLLASLES